MPSEPDVFAALLPLSFELFGGDSTEPATPMEAGLGDLLYSRSIPACDIRDERLDRCR